MQVCGCSENRQYRWNGSASELDRRPVYFKDLTAQLKQQAAQIQKVSAQLEVNKPTRKVVVNK
jgi:hypothetical protein